MRCEAHGISLRSARSSTVTVVGAMTVEESAPEAVPGVEVVVDVEGTVEDAIAVAAFDADRLEDVFDELPLELDEGVIADRPSFKLLKKIWRAFSRSRETQGAEA